MEKPTPSQGRSRRDFLLQAEEEARQLWNPALPYNVDAPLPGEDTEEKFLCCFPYPYMNGRLHLGHAFSISKAEFASRFQRLLGKRVLFPFGFHATGVPIPVGADKLRREMKELNEGGQLKVQANEENKEKEVSLNAQQTFVGKKTKAASKSTEKTQWDILKESGVPEAEIPKFTDPHQWLKYFPSLAMEDLKKFGLCCDWRRSFVTTNINPFYDAFIRWQFNRLKLHHKIKFGLRSTIFSRLEGQPCADHERRSGENVLPQEYTLIKLTILEVPEDMMMCVAAPKKFIMLAATLRPETMYGQTNCFILPNGVYGLYLGFDKPRNLLQTSVGGVATVTMPLETALEECPNVYICSRSSALNMAYQAILPLSPHPGADGRPEPHCLKELEGRLLLGLPVHAPNSVYEKVYSLPMTTILMDKGTGIVTSVPSDAPDDYAALMDIKKKPDYFFQEYGLKRECFEPFSEIELIELPGLGCRYTIDLYYEKKVQSHKDAQKLKAIKEEVYKKGFYEGVLKVGPHAGKKVIVAKSIIKDEIIKNGDALSYYEPEQKVVARSGETCVVALCNQWYLDYGEDSWRNAVADHVKDPSRFRTYSEQLRTQFLHVLSWLTKWACSRQYGLGSYLPWEVDSANPSLIESLSDSTIYMAYYTIAHLLQDGVLDGSKIGPMGILPEQLTDDVFDYIFLIRETPPSNCDISASHLEILRNEFSHWYPYNLRPSGKDLIFNHLTMSLYNHAAIWPDRPDLWPKGMYCNGHILVDNEKMSKSLGNFLTMSDTITEFSADATRLALADAGDTLDDSNFSRENANSLIMRLYLLHQFVQEFASGSIPMREGEKILEDKLFENEIVGLANSSKESFEKMEFRDGLKTAWYDFATRRDQYRLLCSALKMHKDSVKFFIETQLLIISPLAPHSSEYMWSKVLKKPSLVVTQLWPTFDNTFDADLSRRYQYIWRSLEQFRKAKEKFALAAQGVKGKKSAPRPAAKTDGTLPELEASICVARSYASWQAIVLEVLRSIPLNEKLQPPSDFMNTVTSLLQPKINASKRQQALSFASFQMKEVLPERGISALDSKLPYDELALLEHFQDFLQNSLGLAGLKITLSNQSIVEEGTGYKPMYAASPGKPAIFFSFIEPKTGVDTPVA